MILELPAASHEFLDLFLKFAFVIAKGVLAILSLSWVDPFTWILVALRLSFQGKFQLATSKDPSKRCAIFLNEILDMLAHFMLIQGRPSTSRLNSSSAYSSCLLSYCFSTSASSSLLSFIAWAKGPLVASMCLTASSSWFPQWQKLRGGRDTHPLSNHSGESSQWLELLQSHNSPGHSRWGIVWLHEDNMVYHGQTTTNKSELIWKRCANFLPSRCIGVLP